MVTRSRPVRGREPRPPTGSVPGVTAISPPHPDRVRVFAIAVAAIAVDTAMFSAIVPALPVYQQDLGLSDTAVALIFAAFPAAQLLVALFAVRWVDRAGRRTAIITGAALLALAGVGLAVASDPYTLTLARALLGGASALTWTGALASVSDVYPQNQLGFRLGLAEIGGAGVGLTAPLLSGVLIESIGLTGTFLIFAGFPVLLIAGALLGPETLDSPPPSPGILRALADLWQSAGARAGALALILLAIVEGMLEPLLPLDLTERLGLGPAAVGVVVGLGMGAVFLGAPIGGRWSDRVGRRTPVMAGGIIVVVSLPFLGLGTAWWVTIGLTITLLGAAIMAAPAGPLFTHAVNQMGLVGSYGISAGAMVVIYSVGFVIGPVLGGVLSAFMPFVAVCITVAAIVAAGLVVIARLLTRAERQ